MTGRGRLALALGATTYLAAWAFGSKILYPVAIGLPVAVLLAWLWTALANRPLRIRRTLASGERLEGEDVEVTVRLDSEHRLVPARWTLRERIGKLGEIATPVGATGYARYVLERLPRGRYEFERSVAVIEDPFGLERVEQALESPGRCSSTRAWSSSTGSSPRAARARTTAGGCCCGGPPASTCTACATTSTATRCARCTGARPRGAGS